MNLWLLGERYREVIFREFEVDMYTLLYLKWITHKNLLYMELCSILCGSLDGRGIWGRMGKCICMAEFLCCSLETVTTLLISYPNTKQKVLLKKES